MAPTVCFLLPSLFYRCNAIGNGTLPSPVLRKGPESGAKPQRIRRMSPNNQTSVRWVYVCKYSPSLSLPISQTAVPRPGDCRSNGDGGRGVFEPVLNPVVVAKQPDLTLEMSVGE